MKKRHPNDQASGPATEEAEAGEGRVPEGQIAPEDSVESEGEKHAREVERGLDNALTRVAPD